jgi:hypothetical protein
MVCASTVRYGRLICLGKSPALSLRCKQTAPLTAYLTVQGREHAQQQPELLGTTERELGIRSWLESQGHTLVTTSDKEGEDSAFERELVDAEVIITTPYWP